MLSSRRRPSRSMIEVRSSSVPFEDGAQQSFEIRAAAKAEHVGVAAFELAAPVTEHLLERRVGEQDGAVPGQQHHALAHALDDGGLHLQLLALLLRPR